jgi:hypothetical protein
MAETYSFGALTSLPIISRSAVGALGMLAGTDQPLYAAGNASPAKIGSMPHRDTAVSRDVLDRFAERLVRLPGWRSAEAGAGRCVDLIAMALVAAG